MVSLADSFRELIERAAAPKVRTRSTEMIQALKDETPVDTGEARAGWRTVTTSKGFKVINDVEHIVDLNEGSSQQAPSNFIEYTLMKFGKLRLR